MANYRQIHTSIWKDSWFLDLSPAEKLLFIYLFSNDRASLAGIYEVSARIISFETGMSPASVTKTMKKFSEAGKVHMEGNVVWVVHMKKYHATKSETVLQRIQADIDAVPDCDIKQKYLEDTLSIPYPQGTEEEEIPPDTVLLPDAQLKGILNKEEVKDTEKKEEEEEFAPEGGPSVSRQQLDDLCDYFKLKVGKIIPADVGVLAELLKVFRPGDIKRGIDHMLTRTDRPNTGLLGKVLKDWSQERKIHKVYG